MRNPNGYGSVVKLSGNRRRPYMARVTSGWTDDGRQIYQSLGYFERKEDALVCLANYHAEPYNIDDRNVTMEELYALWKETKAKRLSPSLAATLASAYKHCADLHPLPYRTIKAWQMQKCIDDCPLSRSTKTNIRNVFWHLDRFAYELDITSKRWSDILEVDGAEPKEKTIFTDEEVRGFWKRQGEPGVDELLFMLYTGMRISEVFLLKCEDIDLEQGTMRCGVKTAAGKNRLVPIHDQIRPLVERHMGDEYLFAVETKSKNYLVAAVHQYRKLWDNLKTGHSPHECRHTFRSKLDSAGANPVAIDRIMGHKSQGTGERVYTHKTVKELKDAISLLKY